MKSRGLLNVFGLLTIMLLILGVAYAHWTDTVVINTTVKMGEFIVGILDGSVVMEETTNGVPEEEFSPPKPWVCNATVMLCDSETSEHHVPPQTVWKKMFITINNAYPQWDLHINFTIKNAGTIPAKLMGITFSGEDVKDDANLDYVLEESYYDACLGAYIFKGYVYDERGREYPILNFRIEAYVPEDVQLEPCTEYPVSVDLDIKQTAEECHTYKLELTIDFIQWNKAGEVGGEGELGGA